MSMREALDSICSMIEQEVDSGVLGSVQWEVEDGDPYVFIYPSGDTEEQFTAVRDAVLELEFETRSLEFSEAQSDMETHSWVAFRAARN